MKRSLPVMLALVAGGGLSARANVSELTGLHLDTRSGVRVVEAVADVAAIAFNNDAAWTAGGNTADDPAVAELVKMEGDASEDTETWSAVPETRVMFGPGVREGTYVWRPSSAGLYRLRLLQTSDGEALEAYFAVGEAADFPSALEPAEVVLEADAVLYDGTAKMPAITSVTVGSVTLTEGVDFGVFYSDNVEIGTGHVNLIGKGSWGGALAVPFSIVAVTASESTLSGLAMDLRTNDVLQVGLMPNLLPIAWNDEASWPIGGSLEAGHAARLSAAPMDENDEIVGAFSVFGEFSGEGVTKRHPPTNGRVCLKLEFVTDGVADDSQTLMRKLVLNPLGFMLLLH